MFTKQPCTYCGGLSHTSLMCQRKPRKPLQKIGKQGQKWIGVRREYIKLHPSTRGIWECYYCGQKLTYSELTIDHKQARSRRPDLRYELDNLVSACVKCNQDKGSRSEQEYLQSLGHLIESAHNN